MEKFEFYSVNDDAQINIEDSATYPTQYFKMGVVGNNDTFTISSINIKVDKTLSPTGTLTISVYAVADDGVITNTTALSTGTHNVANIGTPAEWIRISMSAATIERDKVYAITVNVGAGSSATDYIGWRRDETAPTYADAEVRAWDGGGAAGTWLWRDMSAANAFLFEVWGGAFSGTLCTAGDIVNKAGANANATAIRETLINNFALQAEAFIAVATRDDWVALYSSLSANKKKLLNQICSDLAAIYTIQYNMVGYTTRVEAETMINVLRESAMRGILLLRDQKSVTFLKV